jgi:type IV fimbrial biogenesis protein FimT
VPGRPRTIRGDERGFTLVELVLVILLMGIVFAIASSTWFGAIESRRVDAATNQVVADLRLAHTQAIDRLTDSSFIVPSANSPTYQIGPAGNLDTRSLPDDNQPTPRTKILDATTIVFKADGSAQSAQAVGGIVTIRVSSTKDPTKFHTIKVNITTSRIQVVP